MGPRSGWERFDGSEVKWIASSHRGLSVYTHIYDGWDLTYRQTYGTYIPRASGERGGLEKCFDRWMAGTY